MERTLCTASSDSDDATTEMDEEGAPSNAGQQGSLYELKQSSTTEDTPGSSGFVFINKAVSPKKTWDSMGSVKAEPGEKPLHKDIQDLIHFRKKDGNKVPVPHGMRTTMAVNISEENESEDLTRQTMCEAQEKVLVTEEGFVNPAEELEFHSSEFGVSWKQNPRKSEVQKKKKKRNFTEDGHSLAAKLAKTSEHPQKNQMPCASTKSGESVTDLTRWKWSESFQARQQEENYAAEEPINCTLSTEYFSRFSQLQHTGEVTYNCPQCDNKFKSSFILILHCINKHDLETPYKCPECNKHFVTEYSKCQHLRIFHFVKKRKNRKNTFPPKHTKGFAIDEALDFPWEGRE